MDNLDAINGQNWNTAAPYFTALAAEELTADGVGDWLLRWSDLEKVLGEAGATAGRAKSEDTTDEAAEAAYLNFVQNIVPKWTVAAQALKTKMLDVPGYAPPPEHRQFLRRLRNDADLFRAANVPIQAQLQTLASDYDKRTGPMTVTLGGKELTLPQAEQLGLETDRAVREEAWRAVQNRWLESRKDLDALYLQMLPLRRQLAKNAGLADYRAYMWRALRRFDYTPEDSLAFGQAIEAEVVPLAQKILETRRQTLGVKTLRPWDLNVDPEGRSPLRPFADVAALEAGTAQIFAQVDPELGREFEKIRHGFLDLDSRKGKAPGGYCAFFPKTGLPYIFMNAVGTESDIRTLLHEGGHAFHGLASSAAQPLLWNRGAPMEFNEVASMAMELLALPYLGKESGGFYTPEDAARARREQWEKIVLFLPYMAVVDGFQHWVYAEAPENATAADMDAQWDRLWTRFMGSVDWSGLEAERVSGWHRKLHIFTVPFYYVEYGLAQLGPCRSGATPSAIKPMPSSSTARPWRSATRAPCLISTPPPERVWPSTAKPSANSPNWSHRIWKSNLCVKIKMQRKPPRPNSGEPEHEKSHRQQGVLSYSSSPELGRGAFSTAFMPFAFVRGLREPQRPRSPGVYGALAHCADRRACRAASARPGAVSVQITDDKGKPVTGATVAVQLAMPAMDMGRNQAAAQAGAAGVYTASGRFTMPGDWQATVQADKGAAHQSQSFPVTVK